VSKIAVIGASGFVGAALCERLFFEGSSFTAFVHSTGNAARVARLGCPLRILDTLQKQAIPDALTGHDVIVNCTMGSEAAMSDGVRNLMDAAARLRPRKFIHLSSTAIYGENPAPDCVTEEGKPDPQRNPYAILKLKQDEMAFRLNARGVPTVILCPTNIVGPFSLATLQLLDQLRSQPAVLVDGGQGPSNLVHVDNLVEAILTAARTDAGAGERFFVNETEPITWKMVFEDHARFLGRKLEFVQVSREDMLPYLRAGQPRSGLAQQAKALLSPEFRKAISMLPPFGWLNQMAGSAFRSLPASRQNRIRERLQWPISVPRAKKVDLTMRFCKLQLRNRYHSPAKLMGRLGWKPPLNYSDGMETIREWLDFAGVTERAS